jgi:hypothetical protein
LLYFFQPIAVNFAQFEFFSEAAMKSVVISVSLFLAALYLAVTISREPMRAQAIIPTRDIAGTISQAKPNILLAEAVDPSLEVTVDQENSSDVVTKIEDTWEKQYEDYFGENFSDQPTTTNYVTDILGKIAIQTGKKPALLYVIHAPATRTGVNYSWEPTYSQARQGSESGNAAEAGERVENIDHEPRS